MQLFYTTDIRGDFAYLSEEEARHCVQVLRRKMGDTLHFVDGDGYFYEGEIVETGKKKCVLSIKKKEESYITKGQLHIGIAPTKNIARLEWFLEKATEIGIQEITPILCRRSERKKIRQDRLEKVLVSAMKQSLKARLPKLNDLSSFKQFVNGLGDLEHYQKFIAYIDKVPTIHLNQKYLPGKDVIILIGPEGGFAEEEVAMAVENGFEVVNLGNSRLRTETAGLVACHTIVLGNNSRS